MPSREASLKNLEKARAAWSHPARPWRSLQETRVIKRLVWQWFNSREPGKWSGRAVARWLGVTHTYIQKLTRGFVGNPRQVEQDVHRNGAATFEHLSRAREVSRKHKERGWLRPPLSWTVVEFNGARFVVRTKAEDRRRAAELSGRPVGPTYVPVENLPLWAEGLPYYSLQIPCDPHIAVKYAMQQKRSTGPVHIIRRRWRPRRPQ